MDIYRPNWVLKFTEIEFPVDWADKAINKHSNDFVKQISEDYSPLKFIGFDPQNLSTDKRLLNQINMIPEAYTLSEVLLFVLDIIEEFSNVVPESDDERYKLYNKLDNSSEFDIDSEFSEFYLYLEKISLVNIRKLSNYKLVESTVKNYTYSEIPVPTSHWNIEYQGHELNVEVVGLVEMDSNIVDPSAKVEVISSTGDKFENGDNLTIPPLYFEKGEMITV